MGGRPSRLRVAKARKRTITVENDRIKYTVSSVRGYRSHMEDYHANILDLGDNNSTSFFGVFDGHGGTHVASHCAQYFPIYLREHEEFDNNPVAAIENVCLSIDEELQAPNHCPDARFMEHLLVRAKLLRKQRDVGSTACIALTRGNQIIVGNVGDSHCILSRNGQEIDLGRFHKPDLETESTRIVEAGGAVTRRGRDVARVNGILAMSRAFGDFRFKSDKNRSREQQMVICDPEILSENITHDTEFLFIASDGVWDVMQSQQVVNFIQEKLQLQTNRWGTTDLDVICQALVRRCARRSRDNVTAILVQFNPPLNVQPTSSNTSRQLLATRLKRHPTFRQAAALRSKETNPALAEKVNKTEDES